MTTLAELGGLATLGETGNAILASHRPRFASRRLEEAFEAAAVIPVDDASPLASLSDCHRGDNSRADAFAVHGHQADLMSDRFIGVARPLVRHVWRPIRLLGFVGRPSWPGLLKTRSRVRQTWRRWLRTSTRFIERRLLAWARDRRQITICGHTHRAACARQGAPPYFNAGSCTYPGAITGLEIRDGWIQLIQWSTSSEGTGTRIQRQRLAEPRDLRLIA